MKASIEICMGSSCFARGNGGMLNLIEDFLERHNLTESVELSGLRCRGDCSEGPNIAINGIPYRRVDPGTLQDLLTDLLLDTRKA